MAAGERPRARRWTGAAAGGGGRRTASSRAGLAGDGGLCWRVKKPMNGIDGRAQSAVVAVGEFLLTLYCKITLAYDMPGCRINAREAHHWVNFQQAHFCFFAQ